MLTRKNVTKKFSDSFENDLNKGYILAEDWNGMERMSPEWFRVQVGTLSRVINGSRDYDGIFQEDAFNGDFFVKELDTEGLIAMLNEMAVKDYKSAGSFAFRMMSHLLYVHTAPNNTAVNHWLDEIDSFRYAFIDAVGADEKHELGNTNIRNRLHENWTSIYKKAVRHVLTKAKRYSKVLFLDTTIIPVEASWTVEDFLTKETESLDSMIH